MADLFGDFILEVGYKGVEGNPCDLVAVAGSQTHGFVAHLIIAKDDEVGGLKFAVITNFLHDVVAGVVHFNTNAFCSKSIGDFGSVSGVFFTNRDDMALGRREPGGETSTKVLDEHTTESFH